MLLEVTVKVVYSYPASDIVNWCRLFCKHCGNM